MAKKRANGEGTIRKRSDGLWEARLSILGSRTSKSFYGKTQAEARKKRDEAKARLGKGVGFDARNLTLGEYMERWLNDSVRDSVKERTYDGYAHVAHRHIIPALGSVKLDALTPAHIQALYRKKLDAELSNRT